MKTVRDFDDAQLRGRPNFSALILYGGPAHIVPNTAKGDDADEFRALCDTVASEYFQPRGRRPMCPACVALWEMAAAIDRSSAGT
jgi:hypothetical protein